MPDTIRNCVHRSEGSASPGPVPCWDWLRAAGNRHRRSPTSPKPPKKAKKTAKKATPSKTKAKGEGKTGGKKTRRSLSAGPKLVSKRKLKK